jgi:hypothetical protein
MPFGQRERWRDPARQRGIPLMVACYRLLAEVANGLLRPVRVSAWEHPWVRRFAPTDSARMRRVRLPAAAALRTGGAGDARLRVLLLPDLGTTPLASYRPTLRALHDLRRTAAGDDEDRTVLIIGVATSASVSTARAQAWRSLLRDLAARADDPPLRARVLVMPKCATDGAHQARRPTQLDDVFALVARHPLLTRHQAGVLLRTSAARIARLETELMQRGWLRPATIDDQPPVSSTTARDRGRIGVVELTVTGQHEAARRLLVPAGLARRRHGITASDASRRRFVRHLHHTLGANAFFVDLAATAARVTSRGHDEALVEWRSAAACARGWFRPDGYGCYRSGNWRCGFFLEYDRGTERSSQYAAKLATYFRYRDSGAFKRDYTSFPPLLVVTTSELAEARFAHQAYLAQQRHAGTQLSVFLTTSARIRGHPDGALGPVWRGPGAGPCADNFGRGGWLPASSGRVYGSSSATALRTILPIVV